MSIIYIHDYEFVLFGKLLQINFSRHVDLDQNPKLGLRHFSLYLVKVNLQYLFSYNLIIKREDVSFDPVNWLVRELVGASLLLDPG